ncbi:hypothetical protein CTA1_8994 [Colletotrichum tanaceti]|uniref:Uncharacterized protein n=1 Tax=Colletotrichum tanaceti TaxID=1306861 RepID=A0A4U6X171_9PEZI|nr:hypothetical protein CTA1_8994 [Colletotrichum tanaceti]
MANGKSPLSVIAHAAQNPTGRPVVVADPAWVPVLTASFGGLFDSSSGLHMGMDREPRTDTILYHTETSLPGLGLHCDFYPVVDVVHARLCHCIRTPQPPYHVCAYGYSVYSVYIAHDHPISTSLHLAVVSLLRSDYTCGTLFSFTHLHV